MTVALIAAAFFLSAPSSSPTPIIMPPPSIFARPDRSMREVVFGFTYDESDEWTRDVIGSPPESQTALSGYSGTMTVDVMNSNADGDLRVAITEATDAVNGKKPFVYNMILRHDGRLVYVVAGSSDASDAPLELYLLLPYLATNRFGDHSLQSGSSWQEDTFLDFDAVGATYSVSSAANGLTDVHIVTTHPGSSHDATTIDERLEYEADLQVAKALDVYVSVLNNGVHGTDARLHYHFKLTSDTPDQSGAPR